MEDPQMLREIDALIESYNWDSLTEQGTRFAEMLKEAYRTQSASAFSNLASLNRQTQLRVFQVFVTLLKHPHTRHKAWILESISALIVLAEKGSPYSPGLMRMRRELFDDGERMLRRYARHCRSLYRRHAVIALARLMPHPDAEVRVYLDALRHEHSFAAIFHIVNSLQGLFTPGASFYPSTQSCADVLAYAETLLKSHSLPMRLLARIIYLYVMRTETPQSVLDGLAADWPLLDARREWHSFLLWQMLYPLHFLEDERCQTLSLVLVRNSRYAGTAHILATDLCHYFLPFMPEGCRRAFTPWEFSLIDALIRCHPLWQDSRIIDDELVSFQSTLSTNGLETTRRDLRHQLQRAYVVDETPQHNSTRMTRLPLYWNSITVQVRRDVSTAVSS